jgi:hypothetical protein
MSKLVLIRIVFVALTVLAVFLILRQMEIDACLDGGGSYNYAFKKCETAATAGYVPILQRDHWYVSVIFASSIAGLGMFVIYKLAVWILPASWKRRRGLNNGAI